jgi:hypothetical protein
MNHVHSVASFVTLFKFHNLPYSGDSAVYKLEANMGVFSSTIKLGFTAV